VKGAGGARVRAFDLLSAGSFVVLGLPDGIIGTAWPAMRRTFDAPVGDLGLVLVVATAGAVAVSAVVGSAVRRLGVPVLLGLAATLGTLGAVGFSLAPGLDTVIGFAFLLGLSSGSMDGGLNTAVGLSGRNRLLNLLHGAYGVGTAVGPLVVTAAIIAGSWRAAYLALAVVDLGVAGLWVRWRAAVVAPVTGRAHRRTRINGQVFGGMVVFFVYTGLEVSAGQWETSFSRQHLGLSAFWAGVGTFAYWGALTVVRLVLAAPPSPPPPGLIVRSGGAVAVAAAAVIWWQPNTAVTLAGFAVLGAALAGVFPALVALTPGRVGGAEAQDVIAWQVGAAAAGGSGVAAIIGALIGAAGFAVLGPSLVTLAVVLCGLDALVWRRQAAAP
jgi:fucose permease